MCELGIALVFAGALLEVGGVALVFLDIRGARRSALTLVDPLIGRSIATQRSRGVILGAAGACGTSA